MVLASNPNQFDSETITVSVDEDNHLVMSRTGTSFWKVYSKDSGVAPAGLLYPFGSIANVLGLSSTVAIPMSTASDTFLSPVN